MTSSYTFFIHYDIPPPPPFPLLLLLFLRIEFTVGDKPVKQFRMIERHYFRNRLLKSFDFDFGFCIPNSRNTCEHIYEMPELTPEESKSFNTSSASTLLPSKHWNILFYVQVLRVTNSISGSRTACFIQFALIIIRGGRIFRFLCCYQCSPKHNSLGTSCQASYNVRTLPFGAFFSSSITKIT